MMLVKLCFEAMTENLFFLSYVATLAVLALPGSGSPYRMSHLTCAAAGALVGSSILIRPTLLWFSPVILVWWGFVSLLQKEFDWRSLLRRCVLFVVGILLLVMPWVVRNYRVAGFAKVCTVDTHNLIYFVGAGAYQVREEVDRRSAQQLISVEYDIPSYSTLQNPHFDERSVAELEAMAEEVKWKVAFSDPRSLMVSSTIGIMKALVAHPTESEAALLGDSWNAPGLVGLLRADSAAIGRLFANSPALVALFIWQVLHTSCLWMLSGMGLMRLLFSKEDLSIKLNVLVLLAFGVLMIVPFGLDAVYRSRLVLLPLAYCLAGLAVAHLYGLVRGGNRVGCG